MFVMPNDDKFGIYCANRRRCRDMTRYEMKVMYILKWYVVVDKIGSPQTEAVVE